MKDLVYEQRKAALIDEITAAFDGVSREGGVSLHEAIAIEANGSDDERASARAHDVDTKWQDVPDEHVELGYELLHFLDAVGFRYYIPAYLVWYLRNLDNEDPDFWSSTFDAVEFHLLMGRGVSNDHRTAIAAFTVPQSRAVAKFLVLLAECHDIATAQGSWFKRRALLHGGMTWDEIRAAEQSDAQLPVTRSFGVNEAALALDKYWGQFLVDESK